jgi:hypothetical protein
MGRYFINGLPIYGAGEPAAVYYEAGGTGNNRPARRDPFCKYWDDKPAAPREPAAPVASEPEAPAIPPTKISQCNAWMVELLTRKGMVEQSELIKLAKSAGFNKRMVVRSRKAINAKAKKIKTLWFVRMPGQDSHTTV